MVCNKCGYQNTDGAVYCSGCGKKLGVQEKWSNTAINIIRIILAVVLLISVGYLTIHNWSEATCTELSTCSICGKVRGELKAHQWPENTIKKLINCVSCGEPNRIMVTYADDAVASSFANQDVWFELDNGKEVGCSVIKLNKPIYNCSSVIINLEIIELRAGNVQGEWGFYVRDVYENWKLADTFELIGDSARAIVTFEEPVSFDAWACPCHELGSSWDFNFAVWLSNPNVFVFNN